MHGGYLRKAAVAASRTSSPAKALRAVLPVAVPRAGVGPALRTEASSVEDGAALVSRIKHAPLLSEPPLVTGNVSAEASGEISAQQNSAVPLSAALREMTKPAQRSGEGASEAKREGPRALAQTTQSEAQANAMAGVLQRLSRPATRVQAPMGLREMRAAAVNARSQAVLPAAEGAHSSGEQRGKVRVGDDLDTGKGIHSPRPLQEVHARAMLSSSRDWVVVRSLVEPARMSTEESRSSTQRIESATGGSDAHGAAVKHVAAMTERQAVNRADAAGQGGKAAERSALDRKTVERVVEEQISAKAMPVVERGGRVSPRQIEAVTQAVTGGGQNKSERKVRIGQIDVHVNNQPAARRTPERAGAVAQKASGVVSSQDLSRFLLRY